VYEFTTHPGIFSLREQLISDKKTRHLVKEMTTDSLGLAYPDFLDTYGKGKRIEVFLTFDHLKLEEMLPDAKKSGMIIEKNGTIKVNFGLSGVLNVENNPIEQPNVWEPVWDFAFMVSAKAKVSFKRDKKTGVKKIRAEYRSAEIDQILIKD